MTIMYKYRDFSFIKDTPLLKIFGQILMELDRLNYVLNSISGRFASSNVPIKLVAQLFVNKIKQFFIAKDFTSILF